MTKLFPSIIPDDKSLTVSEVEHLFDVDGEETYRVLRQATVVINDFTEGQTEISGRSTKQEMKSYMAGNFGEEDLRTIRRKALERMND
jgi:hypothetical protein